MPKTRVAEPIRGHRPVPGPPLPVRRQLGTAADSLALVSRVLALAPGAAEQELADAFAAEARALLAVPAVAVVPAGSVTHLVPDATDEVRACGRTAGALSIIAGAETEQTCTLVLPLPGDGPPPSPTGRRRSSTSAPPISTPRGRARR